MTAEDPPSRAEFHQVIDQGSDRWFSACLRITRNRDLAEDAVQDALLSAWNKRHQFRHGARLDTWIHRIAVNAALQLIRKQKPGLYDSLDDDPQDSGVTPDAARYESELDAKLAGAMIVLSDIERMCFVLKHLEQWRLREIAEELDIKVDAVKQALFRAVKKLRIEMATLRSESK